MRHAVGVSLCRVRPCLAGWWMHVSRLLVCHALAACQSAAEPGSLSQFNGVYDWTITVRDVTGTCQHCVTIRNARVSNNDGTFFGGSIDDFGNLTFNGPCPVGGDAMGTFTGKPGGLASPQWLGTWTCSDGSAGGATSTWKIFNQR